MVNRDNTAAMAGSSGARQPIHLSEASAAYYERMSVVLSDPEAVEFTSRDSLVHNFQQQVFADTIANVSLNLMASEVLENFIDHWCDSKGILDLFQTVNDDNLHLLAYHKSGSHVLQTLIQKVSYFIHQQTSENTLRLVEHFATEFAPLCVDICTHLAFDSHGSHVVRVLMQIMCGVYQQVSTDKKSQGLLKKSEYQVFTPQNEFSHLPPVILRKFTKSSRLLEAVTDTFASPTIISIIDILNLFDLTLSKKFNKKLIKCISVHFPQIIGHEVGSFVIQSLISTAGESQYTQLLDENIRGSIFTYATCKHANFVIQTLIANAHTEQHFIDILTELDSERIENILVVGNFGVVYQIVKTGISFPALQSWIKSILLATFKCQHQTDLLIPLILLMIPCDNAVELNRLQEGNFVFQPQDSIHLHGSLIVQTLFSYEKTKLFGKSLLSSSINGVFRIAADPNGSHVLDEFVVSSKIKQKYKNELFQMIEAKLVDFASSKYGSRVFDRIWGEADRTWKVKFINEIAKNEYELKRDFYGRFVTRNCKLDLFKRRRSDWEAWCINEPHGDTRMKRKMEETEISHPAKRRYKDEYLERLTTKKKHHTVHDNIDDLFDQLD